MASGASSVNTGDPLSVVILGAGFIGVSFAAVFLDAGASVTLAEPDAARRDHAQAAVSDQLNAASAAGLRHGGTGALTIAATVRGNLAGADLVLECGPENLEAKQAIFADLIAEAPATTILATASSAIPMSRIVPDATSQRRCLVAHPVNPPAVLRLIEIVPAPATDAETSARAARIFERAGFAPVRLTGEVEGFVLNRLQGAVLREAYRLVEEGIVSATDVDTVMRLGLGPRWALSGPFETAELNTPGGIRAHAARMGPAYRRMGEARGETVDWNDALLGRVEADRRKVLPQEDIPARAAWRSRAVAKLVAARDRIARDEDE